jgi:hypothetical protein
LTTSDPFFALPPAGGLWNACIGRQGDEENYVDGYIEAALELAEAILAKKMWDKRDTLVLPILYNARHAIELTLKMAINQLVAMEVLGEAHSKNHDILSHWQKLRDASLGDETLSDCVDALGPFVASLAQIDEDGQELRYHENREGTQSLADRSLVNLVVICKSLRDLRELLMKLKYRIFDLGAERRTGTFTKACSRRDLLEIAKMLPPMEQWTEAVFDVAKEAVKTRFSLGSKAISDAVNVIKVNRELKAVVGVETNLVHLSDDTALFVVEQWRRLHPVNDEGEDVVLDCFDMKRFEGMRERLALEKEVYDVLMSRLSPEEIADLHAVFYLGRNKEFSEYYEAMLERFKGQHALEKDLYSQIDQMMAKTNFLQAFRDGAARLGRLGLAERLKEY